MAIAFDAKSTGSINPGTSITFAHTCTGSNLILFVMVSDNSAGDNVTSVTYNGVALTRIKYVNPSYIKTSLWYLINPATGAHNVVVSSNTNNAILGISVSYTGAGQTQPNLVSNAVSDSVSGEASMETNINTLTDNSWVILTNNNNAGTPSATNFACRQGNFGWNGAIGFFDSNAPKTPAGNVSETINFPTGDADAIMVFFNPPLPPSGNFFLMF